MSKPLISIIIPVYQVAACLRECLDSLLSQQDECWEAVCVYDRSTDGSLAILEQYAARCSGITLVRGRGKGLSAARNDGLDHARGEFVLFLDADDFYPPQALSRIRRHMERERPDILVFSAEIYPRRPRAPMFYSNYLTTRNAVYCPFRPDALFRELGAKPFVWRNCFRMDFLRQNGLRFHEHLSVGEDQAFQMEAFPLARKILFTRERLYCYRWFREGSLQYVYDRNPRVKLRGHMDIIRTVSAVWGERGLMEAMEPQFAAWAIDLIYSEAGRLSPEERGCLSEAADLLNHAIPAGVADRLPAYDKKHLNAIRAGAVPAPPQGLRGWLGKLAHMLHMRGGLRTLILIKRILFR